MGETLGHETGVTQYQTSTLDADTYERLWPQIERQLDLVPHIWQDYFTKEYLRTVALHKEVYAWCTGQVDGDDITARIIIYGRFIETPAGRGLQFFLALGNDLDRCLPALQASFEKVARDMGVDFVEVYGRPGWVRKLEGFRQTGVILTRRLQRFGVH